MLKECVSTDETIPALSTLQIDFFLCSAQRFFIMSEMRFRPAAVIPPGLLLWRGWSTVACRPIRGRSLKGADCAVDSVSFCFQFCNNRRNAEVSELNSKSGDWRRREFPASRLKVIYPTSGQSCRWRDPNKDTTTVNCLFGYRLRALPRNFKCLNVTPVPQQLA
jgi:hypothetical protein